jgi:Group II intron, maturase-specific domain
MSCFGQMPRWLTSWSKGVVLITSGMDERDERKRTSVEARSTSITPASSLVQGSPPLSGASVPNESHDNPYIGGWINYYGQFYRAQLRSTLQRIDGYLVRGARRKYKRLRERPKGTRDWLARLRRANPNLFAHWRFVNVGGRTSEAV